MSSPPAPDISVVFAGLFEAFQNQPDETTVLQLCSLFPEIWSILSTMPHESLCIKLLMHAHDFIDFCGPDSGLVQTHICTPEVFLILLRLTYVPHYVGRACPVVQTEESFVEYTNSVVYLESCSSKDVSNSRLICGSIIRQLATQWPYEISEVIFSFSLNSGQEYDVESRIYALSCLFANPNFKVQENLFILKHALITVLQVFQTNINWVHAPVFVLLNAILKHKIELPAEIRHFVVQFTGQCLQNPLEPTFMMQVLSLYAAINPIDFPPVTQFTCDLTMSIYDLDDTAVDNTSVAQIISSFMRTDEDRIGFLFHFPPDHPLYPYLALTSIMSLEAILDPPQTHELLALFLTILSGQAPTGSISIAIYRASLRLLEKTGQIQQELLAEFYAHPGFNELCHHLLNLPHSVDPLVDCFDLWYDALSKFNPEWLRHILIPEIVPILIMYFGPNSEQCEFLATVFPDLISPNIVDGIDEDL